MFYDFNRMAFSVNLDYVSMMVLFAEIGYEMPINGLGTYSLLNQENNVIPYIQDLGIAVQGWYPLGGRGYTAQLLRDEAINTMNRDEKPDWY